MPTLTTARSPFPTRGFTILELLMAMAILSVMVTFTLVSFPSMQMTARDTRRKSDLKQYANSLESFANRSNGLYVSYNNDNVVGSGNTALCTALGVVGSCPFDPQDPTGRYHYVSNGTGGGTATASQYVLYTRLEKPVSGTNFYWVVCSNGQSGRAALSTNFTGAVCPASLLQ